MTMTAIATYEDRLFAVCLTAFHKIVREAAGCTNAWKARLETFNRHGLLSFAMPNPIKAPPIDIDHERLDDPRYRRRLARALTRPRPGKNVCARIDVDRERLLADDAYALDICKLLAYRFAGNLLPVAEIREKLVLVKLDAAFIRHLLDNLGPHHMDATRVADEWFKTTADALVEAHPLFIEGANAIRKVVARERAKLAEYLKELAEKTMARFNKNTGEIMAEVRRKADEHLAHTHARIRETAENITVPAPVLDPEKEFRLAVDKRVREHREANRLGFKARLAIWVGGIATATIMAFHLKVKDVTLVEAILPLL